MRLDRLALGAVLLSQFCLSGAQTKTPAATPAPAAKAAPAQAPEAAKPPEKPKTIDELTKDFIKMEGLVTLYRQNKDGNDTVYLELPESRLEKLMLIQVTSGSGMGDTSAFVFHGQPIADLPVRFRSIDNAHVQLIQPNLSHRGRTPESQRGIDRSFPYEIMGVFDVKARQAERKSLLIDVTSFFKSDVGELSTTIGGPLGGYLLDPSGSRIDTVKSFPENFVIRSVYRAVRKGPPGSGPKMVPWAVSFNISELPENDGYRPRIGDPRVGYFITSFEDLTDAKSYDQNVNFIQRWRLEKADPSLAISPPKKPIVWYIDNAVPPEYREAVRKGLLMYNEAFEKVGIRDAIVVKQMPDDADWDIADLRYNVVRWTTGMPFAIALFRANPLTGEILNASLNMDAGFASSGAAQFDTIVDPASQPINAEFPTYGKWASRLCDIEQRGKDMHAMGMIGAETLTPGFGEDDRKKIIEQYVTEVVGHELGHCLGLRHNFSASTELTLAQLGDPATVREHGLGGSIMDYNPFNSAAIGRKDVDFYAQRIGTYDFWAIEYGYKQVPAASSEGEVPMLKTIASKGGLPGLAYQSDGSADDFDPNVVLFDLSKEPLDWMEQLAAIGPKVRSRAFSKVAQGESYYKFTQTFNAGLSYQMRATRYALRYIGGGHLATSFRGDINEKPGYTPIDAASQRRALSLIVKTLFAPNAMKFSKEDLDRLTFNPNSTGNEVSARSRLFPLQQTLASFQRSTLSTLLSGDTLTRMKTNEFRVGPSRNTLTVAELFKTLDRSIWTEEINRENVSDLRRELQRAHLDLLIPMALSQSRGVPNDARDLARAELSQLKARLTNALPKATDDYTSAHLIESLARIDRALDAKAIVTPGQ